MGLGGVRLSGRALAHREWCPGLHPSTRQKVTPAGSGGGETLTGEGVESQEEDSMGGGWPGGSLEDRKATERKASEGQTLHLEACCGKSFPYTEC